MCGHAHCVKIIGAFLTNVHLPPLDAREEHGATPLFIGAANNQVSSIRTLHALGANLDLSTFDGIAPMHIAAANGQTAALRVLHDLGCSIDAEVLQGLYIFHFAHTYLFTDTPPPPCLAKGT
jgi:ankyrin repeat protein